MRKEVEEFLKTSTIHGLNHVYRCKNTAQKLIWCLILIAMAVLCIFECISYLKTFDSLSKTTSYGVIRHKRMVFPEIVICSTFSLKKKIPEVLALFSNKTCVTYIAIGLFAFWTKKEFLENHETIKELNLWWAAARNMLNLSTEDLLDSISVTCEEFVVSCSVPNGSTYESKQCCQNIFRKSKYSPYGRCFSSAGTNIMQTKSKDSAPLVLILRAWENLWIDKDMFHIIGKEWFIILFMRSMNLGDISYFPLFQKWTIRPGTVTHVYLERKQETFNEDSSFWKITPNCLSKNSYDLKRKKNYIYEECPLMKIFVNQYKNFYNCTPVFAKFEGRLLYSQRYAKIKIDDIQVCSIEIMVSSLENESITDYWSIEDTCMNPCQYISYNGRIEEIGVWDHDRLPENYSVADDEVITIMSIVFEEFKTETVRYNENNEASLIGDLGGLIGLITGASFLSIVEIAIFLLSIAATLKKPPERTHE